MSPSYIESPGLIPDGEQYRLIYAPRPIKEIKGFPHGDIWGGFFREVLSYIAYQEGFFEEKNVIEFGPGSGINIILLKRLGVQLSSVTGVEIDHEATAICNKNFARELGDTPYEVIKQDAIEYCDQYKQLMQSSDISLMTGRSIACLPQSTHPDNDVADGYEVTDIMRPYAEKYERYGLTLNAALLHKLFGITDSEFQMVMILSNRVPPEVREGMIRDAGWHIRDKIRTTVPVRQDYNTYIGYVTDYDDGRRFYERVLEGDDYVFKPISAKEAERRRLEVLQLAEMANAEGEQFDAAKALNVWHHLSIYVLDKKPPQE